MAFINQSNNSLANQTVKDRRLNSNGFVSIYSTLIIMGILTLLTIGLVTVVQQSRRNSLDSQLSTQAFYAAESGINDAVRALEADPEFQKTNCDGDNAFFKYELDAATNIGYTCALVDSAPTSTQIDVVPVVGESQPEVVLIQSENGQNITHVDFTWRPRLPTDIIPSGAGYGISGNNPRFPTPAVWSNRIGVVRVDLVPVPAPGSVNRATMVNSSYTAYMYPGTNPGSQLIVRNGPTYQGETVIGHCTNDPGTSGPTCRSTLNLVMSGGGPTTASAYYMRLQSHYRPVSLGIEIRRNASVLRQRGGQAVVDVTGKANDVYRRVQVRVKLNSQDGYNIGYHEAFAMQSAVTICKQYNVTPTVTIPTIANGVCGLAL